MKEVIAGTITSGVLLAVSGAALGWGILTRRKRLIGLSGVVLLLFLGSAAVTGYKLVSKTYAKVSKDYSEVEDAFRPRTGEEIYAALFGKPGRDCVQIRRYQDQIVPRIDYAIWLHFDTCPEELTRVLRQADYSCAKEESGAWNSSGPLANDNWWKPETLGDSVLVFKYMHPDNRRIQIAVASTDSTQVYYQDILD
jgi:hypothetical protein